MDVKPVSVEEEERESTERGSHFFCTDATSGWLCSPKKPSPADSSTHTLKGGLLEPLTGPSCCVPESCERN